MKIFLPQGLRLFLAAGILTPTLSHASLAEYQQAVNDETSLVSFYTFDQSDAQDSKASNHGTATGTVSYGTGIGGSTDKAAVLKGTGHINLGVVPAFDFSSGKGTVEAWVRADWKASPGYNPAIFAERDGGPVNWSVHMNSGKEAVGLWNGSSYQSKAITPAGTNWHHLAVVFDADPATGATTFTEYWDGLLIGTTDQALGGATDLPTQLGSSSPAGLEEWIGALDEVAFYSDALSAEKIAAHYAAYLAGTAPVITRQPVGGTYLSGVAITLTLETKGNDITYAWYHDGAAVPKATNNTLQVDLLTAADLGSYQAVAANLGGKATSAVAQIQLGTLPTTLLQYQSTVRAEPSLISYYTFDYLNAQDSQAAYHGTPQGYVGYGAGMGGGAGQAVVLDGSGHINLGQVEEFTFASGYGTIEAWVRADWTNALGYDPAFFACRDNSLVVWSCHLNRGKEAAGLWNGSSYGAQPIGGAGTSWHHLAAVFDGGWSDTPSFTIYWDGAVAGSSAQGLGVGGALPIELGASSVAGQERWIGALDEVAFYNTALTADRIQAHYTAMITGAAPTIAAPPAGGSYFVGEALTLSVTAQGLDLRYQWLKNGATIADATNSTLAFAALTASDSATYRVRVANPAGSVESSDAVVKVIVPNLTAYQAAVRSESGLISYYTFDNGDANDSAGSHNGVAVDTVAYATGVGRTTDQALVLDGNGHVDLGLVSDFDFAAGKGTVEAWVRADWSASPGYNPSIITERDGNPVNWSLHMNSGKDAAGLWNGATYQALTTSATGTQWHHLAAVFDTDDTGGGLFTLYWDGQPAGQTHQKVSGTTGLPTELGSASLVGQERWIGAFDEVAFYRTALSESTILKHYQTLLGGATTRPQLQFTRAGSQLAITWPEDASGFVLESTATLPAGPWTAVPNVTGHSATVNISSGTQYYRLRQP